MDEGDQRSVVREFMKLHDVPQALSERVMDYVVSITSVSLLCNGLCRLVLCCHRRNSSNYLKSW